MAADHALRLLVEQGYSVNHVHDLLPVATYQAAFYALRRRAEPPSGSPVASEPSTAKIQGRAKSATTRPRVSTQAFRPPKSAVHRLSEADVLAIRRRMATTLIASVDSFGAREPLWPERLSSGVQRQFTSAGGVYKYDTIPLVGATLAFGVAMSHAFENGNKRTAIVALLVFLDRNKTLLSDTTEDDLYDLITQLVTHTLPLPRGMERNSDAEVQAVASWISKHSRQLILGDRLMLFSELQAILTEFGCSFDKPRKNYIKIHCGNYSVRIGRPRRDFELDPKEIKRIRRALHLDEVHGVDSGGFYNLEGTVDSFVNTYRNLMRRLADL